MAGAVRVDAEFFPLPLVRGEQVVAEEMGGIGDHDGEVRVVDALHPEQRPFLAVGHHQEALQPVEPDQAFGKLEDLGRVVAHFAKSGLQGVHFFVLSAS